MKTYRIKTIKSTIIKNISCNKCGHKTSQFDEFEELNHSFGYSSKYDGQSVSLDICEACLLKFIKKCKIKPDFMKYELF